MEIEQDKFGSRAARGLKDRWVVQALFAFPEAEAEDHQTWGEGGLPSNI